MDVYPEIFVVVLNWNQADLTIECLESLCQQEEVSLSITVVDNGSADGSPALIRERFPKINIIENGVNLGFAGGNNVGIAQALKQGFKYIFVVNNDTYADPKMLHRLVEALKPGIGITAPAIYYASSPEELWSVGGKINPILLEVIGIYARRRKIPAPLVERDFLPACAWLVDRQVFEKVGLLDESFFPIYYEDLDFCLRTRRAGFRLQLVRDARLWHKVSQSSGGEHKPQERYLMARNSGYYFRKNMRFWQIPWIVLYRTGSALLWTFRLIFKRDFAALRAYWKGLLDGWLGVMPKAKI